MAADYSKIEITGLELLQLDADYTDDEENNLNTERNSSLFVGDNNKRKHLSSRKTKWSSTKMEKIIPLQNNAPQSHAARLTNGNSSYPFLNSKIRSEDEGGGDGNMTDDKSNSIYFPGYLSNALGYTKTSSSTLTSSLTSSSCNNNIKFGRRNSVDSIELWNNNDDNNKDGKKCNRRVSLDSSVSSIHSREHLNAVTKNESHCNNSKRRKEKKKKKDTKHIGRSTVISNDSGSNSPTKRNKKDMLRGGYIGSFRVDEVTQGDLYDDHSHHIKREIGSVGMSSEFDSVASSYANDSIQILKKSLDNQQKCKQHSYDLYRDASNDSENDSMEVEERFLFLNVNNQQQSRRNSFSSFAESYANDSLDMRKKTYYKNQDRRNSFDSASKCNDDYLQVPNIYSNNAQQDRRNSFDSYASSYANDSIQILEKSRSKNKKSRQKQRDSYDASFTDESDDMSMAKKESNSRSQLKTSSFDSDSIQILKKPYYKQCYQQQTHRQKQLRKDSFDSSSCSSSSSHDNVIKSDDNYMQANEKTNQIRRDSLDSFASSYANDSIYIMRKP